MEYKFNDQQGNRDRSCNYCIVFHGAVCNKSDSIEKNLAVWKELSYRKDGKWSNSTWLVVTKSAKLVVAMCPFDGWPEDYEIALQKFQESNESYTGEKLSWEEANVAFRFLYPKTTARLLALDTAVEELR